MQYNFIYEETTVVPYEDLQILHETTTPRGDFQYFFRSRLQEADTLNKNKRKYPKTVLESIVSGLAPIARNNSLVGELDHPFLEDKEAMKRRATQVHYDRAGIGFKDLAIKNGMIIGELFTLSACKGPDVAGLIHDHIDIGFSLRAMGGVEPMSDGTLVVKNPIWPITYDVVSNPSHANSRVIEFIPETDLSMVQESTSILMEGIENGLELLQEDGINIGSGSFTSPFVNEIFQENFRKVITKGLKFRIT